MKKLLIATAFAAISVAPAVAADMAVKAAPVVARPACAAAQFGGGYVGIHGGSAYHSAYRQEHNGPLNGSDEGNNVTSWGGLVGGQIGYNFANCNTLWGIEVDGSWLSNDRTQNTAPGQAVPGGIYSTLQSRLDGLVTARGRAGIALDNMLLYVTGGVAAIHTKSTYQIVNIPPAGAGTFGATVDDWTWGWVAGFGTEWAFGGNWTLRTEFLYIGTADKSYNVPLVGTGVFLPPFGTANFTHHDNIAIARVGVNYRFGGPVVAKY